jgi:hypothetical protein
MGTDTILIGHPQISGGPLGGLEGTVCYGTVVRRSPTQVVVALRGTDGYAEWLEDGQFPLIPYAPTLPLPPGAFVEQGFWGIYQSLVLTDVNGTPIGPLGEKLPTTVGINDNIVVAGHSLGAPLATYLTLDLVRTSLGQRVSGCYFASPHPGNQAFATQFDQIVGDYVVYNYLLVFITKAAGDTTRHGAGRDQIRDRLQPPYRLLFGHAGLQRDDAGNHAGTRRRGRQRQMHSWATNGTAHPSQVASESCCRGGWLTTTE